MENELISKHQLELLTREAKNLGASASAIISSKETLVKDDLAALCNGEYPCPNYGPDTHQGQLLVLYKEKHNY